MRTAPAASPGLRSAAMVELSPEGVRSPHCPVCDEELVHQTTGFAGWACPQGHGVAATIPLVRTQVDGDTIAELWDQPDEAIPSGRACPFCRHLMVPVEAGVAGSLRARARFGSISVDSTADLVRPGRARSAAPPTRPSLATSPPSS